MIRVQKEDFDISSEIDALVGEDRGIGGICSFMGTVRDMADGASIDSMTLEHYTGMTEKALSGIEEEANNRWNLSATLIIHRYGELYPGDRIVLVVTASPHREEAFMACQFLMDWLKTKAPFWKREEGEAGSKWVDARAADDLATDRWRQ